MKKGVIMKKKIINISLALLLVLSVCLSVSFLAAAKSENKPVAWINAAVNTKKIDDYLPIMPGLYPPDVDIKATIKLLSDGNTVGNVVTHNFDGEVSSFTISINQNTTIVDEVGGAKFAQFVVLQYQKPTGKEYHARFTFIDNGEPGKNDEFLMELWLPEWDPILPPIWYPFAGSDYIPGGGLPAGNVQIHLRD